MKKPVRIARWVVPQDLQAIYDYHRGHSVAKAGRILAEYERVIALLEMNPLLFRPREGGWRVYPFDSGMYLLYYRELERFWLVTGIFHARRSPDSILEQLRQRSRDLA